MELLGLIPQPFECKIEEGYFTLNNNFSVYFDEKIDLHYLKKFFDEHLSISTGYKYNEVDESKKQNANIAFVCDSSLPNEHYRLQLSSNQLLIQASSFPGHFYGMQTFMQLLPPEIYSDKACSVEWKARCITIFDKPRYQWRGMHLDCSRHFQTIPDIKKYLFCMAIHKLNTFHWHLTDDQGWRFESSKYPKLNTIASVRKEKNGELYGPYYYTKNEMKEVVEYARSLAITVLPEIEMPGHSCAVLSAYPEFGCEIDDKPEVAVENNWGVFKPTLCLANEKTMQFLKDILLEVFEIFDSKYIHIGGDEVLPDWWLHCKNCIKLREKLNVGNNAPAYHAKFNNQIAAFLKEHGRRLIGWDEIIDGDLETDNAVMVWQTANIIGKALERGYNVVMTPSECCYFDHNQFADGDQYTYLGKNVSTLQKVYDFKPSVTSDKIIGCQANVWTERILSFPELEWKVFPRLCALCEVCWTIDEKKNYNQFVDNLNTFHFKRLDILHINYAHK